MGGRAPQHRGRRHQRAGQRRRSGRGPPEHPVRPRAGLRVAADHRRHPCPVRRHHRGLRARAEADPVAALGRRGPAVGCGAGPEPAHECAGPGSRPGVATHPTRTRDRDPDRTHTGRVQPAGAGRGPAVHHGGAAHAHGTAVPAARAPSRHRGRRAARGGGQCQHRGGARRVLPHADPERHGRLQCRQHREPVQRAEPGLVARRRAGPDPVRRRSAPGA